MGTSEIIVPVFNPYALLGVSKDASASSIRTSYKKLALLYHPDKTRDEALKSENSKRFQEVQEAYEILNDPRRRKEYDEEQEIEAQIQEHRRKEKEMREKAKRQSAAKQRERDDDYRRQTAERRQYEANRRAEKEYEMAKSREDEQMAAALQAQSLRKKQADEKRAAEEAELRRSSEREKPKRDTRDREFERVERKRKEADAKRMHDEDQKKREDLIREKERILAEEDRRHRDSEKSRKDKHRKQDRSSKMDQKFDLPVYVTPEDEPVRMSRSDRGRISNERLREPLAVPRAHSGRRDGSRGRVPRNRSINRDSFGRDNSQHRDIPLRETDFPRDKGTERVRRAEFYDNGPRRMSTEPIHTDYLRTPPMPSYGSPPLKSQSYYGPQSYSPPASPRPRNSMPAMTTSQSYPGKEKGRDRARDRPNANGRKHNDIPSFARDSSHIPVIADDLDHTPGNRDSGYSTSSNTTPLKETGPRLSQERLGAENTPGRMRGKWVYVPGSDDDEGSTVGSDSTAREKSHRRSSREDTHSGSNLRQECDADVDPFKYMTSGTKSFSYAPEANYREKGHGRHGSEDGFATYVPASHKPRHSTSREVPPVGGTGERYPPSFHRGATWSGS